MQSKDEIVDNAYGFVGIYRGGQEPMRLHESAIDHVRVRVLPDGRMSRSEAAKYIGRATKTLAQWAVDGRGPKSVRVGGRVYYFKNDLDRFIAGEQAIPPTIAWGQ